MQGIHLPAMLWLQKDDKDRLHRGFPKIPIPEFDYSVAIPNTSYQQLAHDDLLQIGPKSQAKVVEVTLAPVESKAPEGIYDELYLPLRESCTRNPRVRSRHTVRPTTRHLNPAQNLPRSEKRIKGLPACLVAGCRPSQSAHPSLTRSYMPKRIPQDVAKGLIHMDQNPSGVKHPGVTPSSDDARAKISAYKPWSVQRSSSLDTFGRMDLVEGPHRNDSRRQADNKDFQDNRALSYEIPPLLVGSPFRLSTVFPDALAGSRSTDQILQPLEAELLSSKEYHKSAKLRREKLNPHDRITDFPRSNEHKNQQRTSTSTYDRVSKPQNRFDSEPCRQDNNHDREGYQAFSPRIPPVRVVSALRFSSIFPNFPADSSTMVSNSQTRDFHSRKTSVTKRSGWHFPGSFDGNNDDPMAPIHQPDTSRTGTATTKTEETLHKRIRRRKGYENLKEASISHKLSSP